MAGGNTQGNPGNAIPVYQAASAAAGVIPVTGGGMVSGLVAKAAPGASFGVFVGLPSGAAAGWLVGYNATAIPADGAVNPALVLQAIPVAAGPSYVTTTDVIPVAYGVGVVYYLTSGANPYANKASSGYAAFMSAKVV